MNIATINDELPYRSNIDGYCQKIFRRNRVRSMANPVDGPTTHSPFTVVTASVIELSAVTVGARPFAPAVLGCDHFLPSVDTHERAGSMCLASIQRPIVSPYSLPYEVAECTLAYLACLPGRSCYSRLRGVASPRTIVPLSGPTGGTLSGRLHDASMSPVPDGVKPYGPL